MTHIIGVDVRFVAGGNRLREAVRENRSRADLYYRLDMVNLHLPPLAQHAGDIALLARYFLEKYPSRQVHHIEPEAMRLLQANEYPGNVCELENIIARGIALATGERIEVTISRTICTLPKHAPFLQRALSLGEEMAGGLSQGRYSLGDRERFCSRKLFAAPSGSGRVGLVRKRAFGRYQQPQDLAVS
ncbi:MAG: sigma 54-interacting transcriptional regulator [Thiohalomonadaceae bacterium]